MPPCTDRRRTEDADHGLAYLDVVEMAAAQWGPSALSFLDQFGVTPRVQERFIRVVEAYNANAMLTERAFLDDPTDALLRLPTAAELIELRAARGYRHVDAWGQRHLPFGMVRVRGARVSAAFVGSVGRAGRTSCGRERRPGARRTRAPSRASSGDDGPGGDEPPHRGRRLNHTPGGPV